MSRFFDPDGLFAQIMNTVLTLVVLNVLWLLCAIPVVTAGAGTAALYAVLFKLRDGDDTKVVRRFFAQFKANFPTATAIWLVLLAAMAVCGMDLLLADRIDSDPARVVAGVGLVLVGMTATVAFPLAARYENTWRAHIKNGFILAVAHLPRLLLAWLAWGACIALSLYSQKTMYVMLLLWMMAGFSCLSYLNLMIFTPVFRKLEPESGE